MTSKDITLSIRKAADALVNEVSNSEVSRTTVQHDSMPSLRSLKDIMVQLKSIFFPGYLSEFNVRNELLGSFLELELQKLYENLKDQIKRGHCYACAEMLPDDKCNSCETLASSQTLEFINTLPKLKQLLNTDVIAAFNGDPAAKNYGEIIYCYPSINTLIHYRVAHTLLKLEVPLIPRIITEIAHSENGIDIHPGAEIGEYFTIDHGTGVVIGETSVIGKNVKIYQGVTLGAKSFPLDENGNPVKGIPRHPIVEDDVIIYANATVLGRISIGKNSVIGANVWITESVAPDSKIYKT
jgi:serine O-acetyltransferase